MKNLRIVSEGNENVSVIDTFLLEKLMIVYRNSLVSTSSSQIVGEHIDNLRANIKDMKTVIRLNHEFNQLQEFHDVLYNKGVEAFRWDEEIHNKFE